MSANTTTNTVAINAKQWFVVADFIRQAYRNCRDCAVVVFEVDGETVKVTVSDAGSGYSYHKEFDNPKPQAPNSINHLKGSQP